MCIKCLDEGLAGSGHVIHCSCYLDVYHHYVGLPIFPGQCRSKCRWVARFLSGAEMALSLVTTDYCLGKSVEGGQPRTLAAITFHTQVSDTSALGLSRGQLSPSFYQFLELLVYRTPGPEMREER